MVSSKTRYDGNGEYEISIDIGVGEAEVVKS
jgi:hypothetical protein